MIALSEPNLGKLEQEYVADAIRSGWVSGAGPYVDRFEDMIAKACRRDWCVATLTGTMALRVALQAAGVEAGSVVNMPSYTFIAAANAVKYLGGTVRFWDHILVDITDLLVDSKIWVIDAAPAIGYMWRYERIPGRSFTGQMAILSFNQNKTLTTGQGGAIVGYGENWGKMVRHLATTAKVGPYEHDTIAFNARMSNINAAIGCAQMERREVLLTRKRAILDRYESAGFNLLRSEWMALLRTTPNNVQRLTRNEEIQFRPFWKPLHMFGPHKQSVSLPETEEIWDKIVCLPCGTTLTDEDQDKVIRCVESLS